MLLALFCLYAGWKQHTWKTPAITAIVAAVAGTALEMGKLHQLAKALSVQVPPDAAVQIATEAAVKAPVLCFALWGMGKGLHALKRWITQRQASSHHTP